MLRRLLYPLKTNSFFLFGARGVGKSTLIREVFRGNEVFELDLLDPLEQEQVAFALPEVLARIKAQVLQQKWIFIDEIQKAPKLLDSVQKLIDRDNGRFILTGSSARKLKRGAANLLGGRAYTYNLFPFVSSELKDKFDLNQYLAFGGLPKTWLISSPEERVLYLRSYVNTYLKEEIAEEQIVRKLEPFRKFLQVAAQASGTILNYSAIARDVGVSDQTVRTYFDILEETLLGFHLPPFGRSIRKAQGKSHKFYLFDSGVIRALKRTIDQPFNESTYEYGILFEHFVIGEIRRRAEYLFKDFSYSYLRTPHGKEIDLIVERPGRKTCVIEIRSSLSIKEEHIKTLENLGADIGEVDLILISRDPHPKRFGNVTCLPWDQGIDMVLGG